MEWFQERSRHGGIDEVPTPGPGRLWLCGKHLIAPDPVAVLEAVGADVVVCLCERHELEGRWPTYTAWLAGDRRARWWAVPDLGPPTAGQIGELDRLLGSGAGVVVHCGAGIGRAGTLAASLLVVRGVGVEEAVAAVAAARPMAGPEAGPQREALRRLAPGRPG